MNDNTPDERTKARAKLVDRAAEEKKAMRIQKIRIGKRASIGKDWDGGADNDNNINWPIGKALLAEGNHDLLKYAMRYRKIYDQAKSEVALGFKGTPPAEMTIARRSTLDESTGRISYGAEVLRVSAGIDIPSVQKTPTNSDSKKNAAPVPKPWTGDMELINALDARGLLAMLQSRIGSTLEPFEMAVVESATLEQVGNAAGIASRGGAMAAGRAIVHMGLIAVRDAIGAVSYKDLAA